MILSKWIYDLIIPNWMKCFSMRIKEIIHSVTPWCDYGKSPAFIKLWDDRVNIFWILSVNWIEFKFICQRIMVQGVIVKINVTNNLHLCDSSSLTFVEKTDRMKELCDEMIYWPDELCLESLFFDHFFKKGITVMIWVNL